MRGRPVSCTTVYAAFGDGDMVSVGECTNAFRGAMWIWTELGDCYVPGYRHGQEELVWTLVNDHRLSDVEHYALLSTFDGAVCPRDLMLTVADALETFAPGTENLARQATLIRAAHENGARAVAWLQTSVCCSPWWIETEGDDGRPWNMDRDTELVLPGMGRTAWTMPRLVARDEKEGM